MARKNIGKIGDVSGRDNESTHTRQLAPNDRKRDLEDSQYLEMAEINDFFAVIKSKRDRAIFRLVYHRGLRRHEVRLIDYSDFRERDGVLYVTRGKGSKSREYSLLPEELRVLRAWLKERGSVPGPMFPSRQGRKGISPQRLDQLMKHYCGLAGIPLAKSHCHALKHSCGTHLAEQQASPQEIQDWLGHRDSKSTEQYLHFSKSRRAALTDRLRDWR